MFREPADFDPLGLEPLERELLGLALGLEPLERGLLGLALGLEPPERGLLGLALGLEPPERGLLGLALGLEPLERELLGLALGLEPPERGLLGLALGLEPPERGLLGLALGLEPPERGLLGLALGFEPPERGCVDRAPLVFRLRGVVERVVVVDAGRRVVVREGAALSREEPDRAGLRSAPLEPAGDSVRLRVVGGLDIWRYMSRTRSALSPAEFCRGVTRWGAVDCRSGTPRRDEPFARAVSRPALVRLPSSVDDGAPRILLDEPGVEYCRGRTVWPRSSSAALRAVD